MRLVCLFTSVFGPGGIQRMNRQFCLALGELAQQGAHEVQCLSLMDDPSDLDQRYLENSIGFEAFRGRKAVFVAAALRQLGQCPDVVFAYHVNLATVGLLLHLLRPSLVYAVHLYGREVWKRLPWLERAALTHAGLITAASSHTRDQGVQVQGVDADRTLVVYPALDPFWVSATERSRLNAVPSLPAGRILLSVARLAATDEEKGLDCVIRALPQIAARVPDVRYVIVGSGDDATRLQSLACEIGVQERVILAGWVSDEELPGYYRNCDLFVLPSKKEGFGIVFLEAMFFGKAVIGGRHGGTPDVVQDGVTGILVEHGNIDGLADAIVRLLGDDLLRTAMGKHGYMQLMSNFGYDQFRKRCMLVLYLLASARPRA